MPNNQGILHLAPSQGGKPFCGNQRGHQSTTPARAAGYPRICVKCLAVQARWDAKRSAAK